MMKEFYERYKTYSKHQIFEILRNKKDYQQDAVNAAEKILLDKNWKSDLLESISKEEQIQQREIDEKAKYYKKIVEFQTGKNYLNIRLCDVPKFEAALIKNNIDFYREDKNVGPQLDYYPTEKYYFKDESTVKVDEICKHLKLNTAPYADIKPFYKMDFKSWLIIILIITIIVLLMIKLR